MSLEPHTAIRPTWECRGCGKPWPCDPAKAVLREEFGENPASIVMYLAYQYEDASVDLRGAHPDDVYDRFLGWRLRPQRMTDNRERPAGVHWVERGEIEAEYQRWTRERAAELGPINAGDPHPSRRLAD